MTEIECTVSDTGIGISDEKKQTIFEVLGGADTSIRRNYGGVGLGLPIAARLVKMMGGKIRMESRTGRHQAVFYGPAEASAGSAANHVIKRPALPLTIPKNWPAFQRHLAEGHSLAVDITPEKIDPGASVAGKIWSASEGFVRAVVGTPLDSGVLVQLAVDGSHHAKGEVVFCQQWPNAYNLGIQITPEGRGRREPTFSDKNEWRAHCPG